MLAFVDEAGDAGMKLGQGSSTHFLVALVTFADHDEALRCDHRIAALRQDLGLSDTFEFHFAQNSARQRLAFLQAVTAFDFRYHVFALNKARASGPGFKFSDSLYKWTTRMAFENAKGFLEGATIVIDGSGEARFRKELSAYLRKWVNDKGASGRVRQLKLQPAHENNLLQLADYVASLSYRAIQTRKDAVAWHKSFLRSHEDTWRVWP